MHIAVCDDNIADRKQTERLLGRQSDRFFKETGERLYIDSYGNVDAFMQHPQMYHGLFVDMTSSQCDGFEIAKMLLHEGITRPIVLCSSTIDYREKLKNSDVKADNILFLDKPIRVAELTAIMDEIRERMGEPTQTMELRGREETIYAKGDDIICIRKKGAELRVFLTDDRTIDIIEDIYNFYDQCNIFPQICPVSDTGLVNVNHVKKTSFGKVTMDNDISLKVSLTYRNAIKQAQEIVKKLDK